MGDSLAALTTGYHAAFLVGALFAAGAAVIGGTLLREASHAAEPHAAPAVAHADS